MTEPLTRSVDKSSSKKSKLPPSSNIRTKSPLKNALQDSENRLKQILNPPSASNNKLSTSFSKDKSFKKNTSSIHKSASTKHEKTTSGKENKSQSPKKKRPKSRSNNRSMISGPLKQNISVNQSMLPTSPEKRKSPSRVSASTSAEKGKKNNRYKAPLRQSLNTSGTLHRRYNSSVVGNHSRVESKDGRSALLSRNAFNGNNNSMLNNSSMLEDPLNYSREFSYLKEYDTSEFVHYSELVGLYNSSYSSNVKPAGSNERLNFGLGISHDGDFGNTHIEEQGEQDEISESSSPFAKGKALFKQKRYREAIEYFKNSTPYQEESKKALYLVGVSHLWLGQYQDAKHELTRLVEKENSSPKCSVFILLSIAYKKLDDISSAIKTLTKAITKYPDRSDIYIFRAKLYLKAKNWERALADFRRSVQTDPTRGIGFIGQGDAARMMGEYNEAVYSYSQAAKTQEALIPVALLKRAIAFTELKRYDEALSDLKTVIEQDPKHSEAFYFKGLVLSKKGDPNEATLCFEQAIKHNTSSKAVVKSLYEIARIKIEGRNFYEASHTIHRAEMMGLDQTYFKKLKLFTEGVIFLMKRKFEAGVTNLTNVLKHHLSSILIPMVYSYRAYGHFCLGKYKKAVQDYQEVQKLSKLDKSCIYNKFLCEGVLAAEIENYEDAEQNFDKALKIYHNKMEPYFYKAVLAIQSFFKGRQKTDKEKMTHILLNSLKDLEKALEINENCSNLYYIRAMVLYTLGHLDHAYASIEKAIEKADENYARYYYLKGAIYGAAGNYYNAISDLSIAISLDKNYRLAYLERGKCYFGLGNLKQAFLDIQKYISIKGNNPNIHLWAGNLLFSTGAYEDAARAYSNSENISKSENLLCLRAKCYIVVKELNLALADLNRLVDLQTPNNILYYIDRECLASLKMASSTREGEDELDQANMVKSIQSISKILSYKMSGEIFQLDDIYFYKSVLHFYLKEYDQALDDLETSWECRQEILAATLQQKNKKHEKSQDHIKVAEDLGSPSQNGSKSLEEEDENKRSAIIKAEYFYNRAIYLLMLNRFSQCMQQLEMLKSMITSATAVQRIDSLIKLVQIQSLRGPKEKVDFLAGDKSKTEELLVFSYTNRLCSIFPSFILPVSTTKTYETRLSFCLPACEPPSMSPTISQDCIEDITVLAVENRPEAPWIKRNPEGIVFTEDFMQKEQKEIENLREVILANGLKEEEVYKSLGNSQKNIFEKINAEAAEKDEIMEYNWENDKRRGDVLDTEEVIAKSQQAGGRKIRRSNT